MEIKRMIEGNSCIVIPNGQLDAMTGPELNTFLHETLANHKNLILDLSKVKFVSSAGLRVFLGVVKEARSLGGDLRLAEIGEDVNKVLSVSGFDRLLKIYANVPLAQESFAE